MKKGFTEEQIIGFLRETERGAAVKDLCRRHGANRPTIRVVGPNRNRLTD